MIMDRVNTEDLNFNKTEKGECFFRRKKLAENTDGKDIGCSLYEIPSGHKSWPYHYHTNNEEAVFVLEGKGKLRQKNKTISIRKGDYISLPKGEKGGHRIINNSDSPLRYLMISTMNDPDITIYPNSKKFGVFVGSPPGSNKPRTLEGNYKIQDKVEYWEDKKQKEK